MSVKQPTLSMCLIVGDNHLSVLARCLRSLIDRPSGPACDEIVIGFNGTADTPFMDAITDAFGVAQWGMPVGTDPSCFTIASPQGDFVGVVIHRGPDPRQVGFDLARNENFSLAAGEWRGYIDADDILPLPNDPAVKESMAEGLTLGEIPADAPRVTLMDWLKGLPGYRNEILAPYNYHSSAAGQALTRTRRPRIVRWSRYWLWTESVHERLTHVLRGNCSVYNPGFLLVHAPVVDVADRQDRNFALLNQSVGTIRERQEPVPEHLLYGLAEEAFSQNRFEEAAANYLEAVKTAPDQDSKGMYLMMAARAFIELGQITKAGAVAKDMIENAPDSSDGYLIACEVAFLMGKTNYAITWYEAGGKKPFRLGGMVDDRIARCIRPVRTAGASYLAANRFREAIEVAQIALAADSGDDYAERIREIAQGELDRQELVTRACKLADDLEVAGLARTAHRMLDAVSQTVVGLEAPMRELATKIEAFTPSVIPPESEVARWLVSVGTEKDIKMSIPLEDAMGWGAGGAADFFAEIEEAFPEGHVFGFATDPYGRDDYTTKARTDAILPESLLATLDEHVRVVSLQLLDGTPRALVTEFIPGKPLIPWKPDITFFCPAFAEPWGPWRLWRDGTGGSEESVIYLAREFSRRGFRVQVFAPLDHGVYRDVHVEDGVRYRPLAAFDPVTPLPGIMIACRAPFAVGMPAVDPARCYTWHQDAGYRDSWNASFAGAQGHFFVSKWQQRALLDQIAVQNPGLPPVPHDRMAVVGDGIPETCFTWQENPPVRDPLAVAYLSSPIRGLEQLADEWPKVREAFPKATLHVFYGWQTTSIDTTPRQSIMAKLKQPGIIWRDRVPQAQLEAELPKFGVWAYPCFPFPEGFCIAGIRATAAGLVPVYGATAAMPEIQSPQGLQVATPEAFLPSLLSGLTESENLSHAQRITSANWADRWVWAECANKMLDQFEVDGVLQEAKTIYG